MELSKNRTKIRNELPESHYHCGLLHNKDQQPQHNKLKDAK